MTSDEVANLVRQQIGNRWDQSNAHGVDLQRCLVQPKRVQMGAMGASIPNPGGKAVDTTVWVWVVLEEDPVKRDGYKIVMEEDTREFGLAILLADGQPCYLGCYGDFMTTLQAM